MSTFTLEDWHNVLVKYKAGFLHHFSLNILNRRSSWICMKYLPLNVLQQPNNQLIWNTFLLLWHIGIITCKCKTLYKLEYWVYLNLNGNNIDKDPPNGPLISSRSHHSLSIQTYSVRHNSMIRTLCTTNIQKRTCLPPFLVARSSVVPLIYLIYFLYGNL